MQHRTARAGASLLATAAATVLAGAAAPAVALSEYGIEGMHVVSTAAAEGRATVSPDGRRIVWASVDRAGGAGGGDLWQARLVDGRWQEPQPLALNTRAAEVDPAFSADGRWLYFVSDRRGGRGGLDLYRAAVREDGYGRAEALGSAVNSAGDERAPMPSADGRHLLLASDGHGGAGGLDLLVAAAQGDGWGAPRALAGVNTAADEFDGAWLGGGVALVFARADDARSGPARLHLAQCDGRVYAGSAPLALSFNTADARTTGASLDWNKPGELLVSGVARAPRAGQSDIYRLRAPAATGVAGCVD